MNRRVFNKYVSGSALMLGLSLDLASSSLVNQGSVRLGGPLFGEIDGPDHWIKKLKSAGYRAAYCPLKPGADETTIRAYRDAAKKNDLVIAEVGAWSNMVSPDPEAYQSSVEKCIESLDLADQIGANCCVNVSGSRNPDHWAGPHEDNLTQATFDLIVETTRKIIDTVNPKRTHFTLEMMPWAYPYSTDTYLDLIRAIDRKQFGVHIDPVNMVVSPQLFFANGEMIKTAFKQLGPYIRSCHAKDITLREDNYIPQLDELQPGLGKLNYGVYLTELAKLKDIPLMMEHLKTEEEYASAANYIRSQGRQVQVVVSG